MHCFHTIMLFFFAIIIFHIIVAFFFTFVDFVTKWFLNLQFCEIFQCVLKAIIIVSVDQCEIFYLHIMRILSKSCPAEGLNDNSYNFFLLCYSKCYLTFLLDYQINSFLMF